MQKLRILVLNEPEEVNAVTHWRMYEPFSKMEKTFEYFDIRKNTGQLTAWDFIWPDVVIAFRCTSERQLYILEMFKEKGAKIIIDYDDNFIDIPNYHDAYASLHASRNAFYKCVGVADMLWVSTEHLKSVYSKYTYAKIVVIPNAVLLKDIEKAQYNPIIKNTIMWRGSAVHRHDIEYEDYVKVAGQAKIFYWVGYLPKNYQVGIETVFIPLTSAWEYFKNLREIKPNVVWKPLENTEFNKSKSNIAWIEATISGAVCLTNMNTSDWAFAQKGLTISWNESKSLFENSKAEIIDKFTLEKVNIVRKDSIISLIEI